ncbi:P-loop containing nucleoside triphosphate hydrolase protein [Pelagophyceae sp. CCMP2097]|nr:P-loop containing nucleoside triphosphate hydrolase protein [Pelagophyceae sp. CCMP2097]
MAAFPDAAPRFLEPGDSDFGAETVVLASYPRSGNSLLRSLVEQLSGVVTGSDTAPDRPLSKALQACGVRGEGVTDGRVHVVKSHYPERVGCRKFKAHRAILLVRNPYDVIDSYFNMTLTNSHNTTMADTQYARFSETFAGLARAEAQVWLKFNRWWLRAPLPLLVVRYEDLVLHRERTLRRIAWFLNGCEAIEGTRWEAGVLRLSEVDLAAAGPYAPRQNGAASNKAAGDGLRRFSDDVRRDVDRATETMLAEFGYDETRGFPSAIVAAPRALRTPVPRGDACHDVEEEESRRALVLNAGLEVRDASSPFGRHMTTVRKQLTEPVLSDDGRELNMHEVHEARRVQLLNKPDLTN